MCNKFFEGMCIQTLQHMPSKNIEILKLSKCLQMFGSVYLEFYWCVQPKSVEMITKVGRETLHWNSGAGSHDWYHMQSRVESESIEKTVIILINGFMPLCSWDTAMREYETWGCVMPSKQVRSTQPSPAIIILIMMVKNDARACQALYERLKYMREVAWLMRNVPVSLIMCWHCSYHCDFWSSFSGQHWQTIIDHYPGHDHTLISLLQSHNSFPYVWHQHSHST